MENNTLLSWIMSKDKQKSFIDKIVHRIKFKRYIHSLKKVSPDYYSLCEICDFFRACIFMLYKDEHDATYDRKTGERRMVFRVNNHIIDIKLEKGERINIDISRNGNVRNKSYISFVDQSYRCESKLEEKMFCNIIDIMMNDVSKQLLEIYNKI